jgi:hypothetical protein
MGQTGAGAGEQGSQRGGADAGGEPAEKLATRDRRMHLADRVHRGL